MSVDLPDTWKFFGSMWWLLHIIGVILIFISGYLIGRYSAEPEPDPVDQDELRRLEKEKSRAE